MFISAYSASNCNLYLHFNSDTTDSNYYNQSIRAVGTTVTGVNSNTRTIAPISASQSAILQLVISQGASGSGTNGRVRWTGTFNNEETTSCEVRTLGGYWLTTNTNVTTITFTASTASMLDAGTRLIVYKTI